MYANCYSYPFYSISDKSCGGLAVGRSKNLQKIYVASPSGAGRAGSYSSVVTAFRGLSATERCSGSVVCALVPMPADTAGPQAAHPFCPGHQAGVPHSACTAASDSGSRLGVHQPLL